MQETSEAISRALAPMPASAAGATGLVDGLLRVNPTARMTSVTAASDTWLRDTTWPPAACSDEQDIITLPGMVAEAVREGSSPALNGDDLAAEDEEEAEERAWAEAEREQMLERAEALWQRTRDEWGMAFAAYGASTLCEPSE